MFVIALPILLLGAYSATRVGSWLVVEDPLQKADAIVVLGGTMYERPLEAVDLYKAGYAPRVYLSRELPDWGEAALQKRGITVPRVVDIQVQVLVTLGVPATAISVIDPANSTKEEAEHLRDLVRAEHFSRLIIVTSKQHTRRTRLIMNRKVAPAGAEIIVHSSRYDPSDTDHWWRDRSTARFTLFETQRLIAYWLHLAD